MSENTSTEAVSTDQAEAVTPAVPAESAAEGTDGQGDTSGTDTVDRAAYDALKAELDAFKRAVAETTGKYAVRHDMCGVVDTALAELGLKRPQAAHRVTVNLSYSYEVPSKSGRKSSAPSESVMWATVRTLTDSLRYDHDLSKVVATLSAPNGAMPGLSVTSATVSAEFLGEDGTGHILPDGPRWSCRNCAHGFNSTSGLCPSCDWDNTCS